MTKVINLLGGSSVGKSTTSCGLYYNMKLKKINVELVREYVKMWAWLGREVHPYDQIYISGKQAQLESSLYNKVDYIITDSPLLLGPIYELFYTKNSIVLPSVQRQLNYAKENAVEHINYVLERHQKYSQLGRFQNEESAKAFDKFLIEWLNNLNIKYKICKVPDLERVDWILSDLKIK